jgi:hypothetical protein
MNLDEACEFLGKRFLTSRPKPSELDAAYRNYVAHGENVSTESFSKARKAQGVIWDHWYSDVEFSKIGDRYLCIDRKHGVYGEAKASDKDAEYLAYEHMMANRLPLKLPEEDFDWRTACLKILNGVEEVEGTWFEAYWDMDSETIEKIRNEYHRWVEQGGPSVPPEGT